MNKSRQLYLLGLFIIIGGIMWGTFQQAIDITTISRFTPVNHPSVEKPIHYFGVVSRYTRNFEPVQIIIKNRYITSGAKYG